MHRVTIVLRLALLGVAITGISLLPGCAAVLVFPAVGTKLDFESCFVTSRGVSLWRLDTARCPDPKRVEERERRVIEDFPNCSFSGARIFLVDGYVLNHGEVVDVSLYCGDGEVLGCESGPIITVRADRWIVVGMIEHELRHLCLNQKYGGASSLEEFDLDHPEARRPFWWRGDP